mmetsp:Transcript_27429/g.72037  ORF Transcript_27429/g.72037 Transcript_27429/m.72037 type:complete len:423 (-) Transcript_27429:665-1933(-)
MTTSGCADLADSISAWPPGTSMTAPSLSSAVSNPTLDTSYDPISCARSRNTGTKWMTDDTSNAGWMPGNAAAHCRVSVSHDDVTGTMPCGWNPMMYLCFGSSDLASGTRWSSNRKYATMCSTSHRKAPTPTRRRPVLEGDPKYVGIYASPTAVHVVTTATGVRGASPHDRSSANTSILSTLKTKRTHSIRAIGCDPSGFGSVVFRRMGGGDSKRESDAALSSCATAPTAAATVNDGGAIAVPTPMTDVGSGSIPRRHPKAYTEIEKRVHAAPCSRTKRLPPDPGWKNAHSVCECIHLPPMPWVSVVESTTQHSAMHPIIQARPLGWSPPGPASVSDVADSTSAAHETSTCTAMKGLHQPWSTKKVDGCRSPRDSVGGTGRPVEVGSAASCLPKSGSEHIIATWPSSAATPPHKLKPTTAVLG